jgi:ribosomal protein S3
MKFTERRKLKRRIQKFFKNLFADKGKPLKPRDESKYKCWLRNFFESTEYSTANVPMSISTLGITHLKFRQMKSGTVEITITLVRPGLIIGKAGKTIDSLTEYLSVGEVPVHINVVESRLWHTKV